MVASPAHTQFDKQASDLVQLVLNDSVYITPSEGPVVGS